MALAREIDELGVGQLQSNVGKNRTNFWKHTFELLLQSTNARAQRRVERRLKPTPS